jgi:hypothetical protein
MIKTIVVQQTLEVRASGVNKMDTLAGKHLQSLPNIATKRIIRKKYKFHILCRSVFENFIYIVSR